MLNALSIDLEDWYYPELVRHKIGLSDRRPLIEESTRPVLQLLGKYNIRATFFMLGEVAKEKPDLIRYIYSKGHEIAFHGMSHETLWKTDRDDFSGELDEFALLINKILGKEIRIKGFRAPSFSLDNSTKWALQVLKEKGYMYDSSVFPVKNKLYGLKGAPTGIYRPSPADLRVTDSNFELLEFPLAVCDIFGVKIPVAGGFYFRTMPFFMLKNFLKLINKNRPFVFYLHPWETYSGTPRIKSLSRADYFITYWGIAGVLKKLESLLKSFSFGTISEVLGV